MAKQCISPEIDKVINPLSLQKCSEVLKAHGWIPLKVRIYEFTITK